MKLKYIFASIVATLALAVGCQKEADHYLNEVKVSSSYLAFPAAGGNVNMTVTATDSWTINELPDWITASTLSGTQGEANITFTAGAAESTRENTFKIVCSGKTQLVKVLQVTEAKEPEIISVAQALALIKKVDKGDGGNYEVDGTYHVKGVVCKISEISTSYGNATYYLSDDGKFDSKTSLQVYRGAWLEGAKFTTGDEFAIGDELTVSAQLMSYKGTPETKEKTAYVVSISKSLIGIEGTLLLGVEEEEGAGVTEFPLEGGSIKVFVMTKGDGFHVEIPADAKSWLHIEDFGSNYVTLMADANEGGDRNVTVGFSTEADGKSYSCEQAFTQKGSIIETTAAEFNKKEDGTALYKIKGVITKIVMDSKDATKYNKYGNFYIQDGTDEMYIYGLLPEAGGASGQDVLTTLGAKVGDVITVIGPKASYNGSPQMKNAYYEDFTSATAITAADFNALSDGSNLYIVSGKVTGIVMDGEKYSKYSNFYIEDATGKVYVYGLVPSSTGASGQDILTKKGVKEGDIITVVGPKASYKGSAQMKNGFYVSHEAGEEEGGGEEGGDEGDGGDEETNVYASNVTWSNLSSAYDDGTATVNGVADVVTLKFGTSKKSGSATITIPAGAKEVSFYGVGWKGSEAKMTIKNGETTVKEISLAANDGATGNAPYTITVADTDKYVVSFDSALTAETALTFESTGRVILFAIQSK